MTLSDYREFGEDKKGNPISWKEAWIYSLSDCLYYGIKLGLGIGLGYVLAVIFSNSMFKVLINDICPLVK